MAILRDYVWKKVGSQTKLLPLNTNQGGGFDITSLIDGTADTKKIRIVPYKGLASTQDLLHVAEDLIENDRRINNEKNAGHSILSDGIFNDQGANFEVEITYNEDTSFKSIKILHGKIKTNSSIYEILYDYEFRLVSDIPSPLTVVADENARNAISPKTIDDYVYQEDIETLYKYNGDEYVFQEVMANPNDVYVITDMPDDNGSKIFRRDYISIVYYDTDKNVGDTLPVTPYWRYVSGENYFEMPIFKNQQKVYESDVEGEEWDSSLNKKDFNSDPAVYREYIIYSISMEYTEDRTEIDTIDIIPDIVGISDLIHFVDADLIYDDVLKLYKVGRTDKTFYHPYKTFTPLDPSYGQGESIVKEGFKTSATEYATNQLMEDYVDFDDEYVSLFNFPFKIAEIENDYTLSDNVLIDHILLGYKKEGFFNGDTISINNPLSADFEKMFEMVDGAWEEIIDETLHGHGSWIPEVASNGQYFELYDDGALNNGIYLFSGTTWDLIDDGEIYEASLTNTRRVRYGNTLPNDVSIDAYFELKGVLNDDNDILELGEGHDFVDGLYQYKNDGGSLEWIYQTYTEGVETPTTPVDYFKAYGGGTLSAGWYKYNGTSWDSINVPNGNAFNGGIDKYPEGGVNRRWNASPFDGEFFKCDGTSVASKGWYMFVYDEEGFEEGYWRKLPIHWGTELPPVDQFTSEIYFACNGEESEIEGPAQGLYKFNLSEWNEFTYISDVAFPSYPDDNDHLYLEEAIGGFSAGMYRFDKGLWNEITKYVNEIESQTFTQVDNHTYEDFPFEANSGNNIEIKTFTDDLILYDELYDVESFESATYGLSVFDCSENLIGYFGFLVRLAIEGTSGLVASIPVGSEGDYYLATDEDILYKYVTDTWVAQTQSEYDYFIDPTNDLVYQYIGTAWTDITTSITNHVYYLSTNIGEVKVFNATTDSFGTSITVVNTDLLLIQEGSYDDSPAQTLTLYEFDDTEPNYIKNYTSLYDYLIVDTDDIEDNPYIQYEYTTAWTAMTPTDGDVFYPINHDELFTYTTVWTPTSVSADTAILATNTGITEIWYFGTSWAKEDYITDSYFILDSTTLKKYNGTIWEEVTPDPTNGDDYLFIKNGKVLYHYDASWALDATFDVSGNTFISTNEIKYSTYTDSWSSLLSLTADAYFFCENNTSTYEKLYKYNYLLNELSTIELSTDVYIFKGTSLELSQYDGDGSTWSWAVVSPINDTYHYSYISKKIYKYNTLDGWTIEGQKIFTKLPIMFDDTYGDYFIYNTGTVYKLYQWDLNTSGGINAWDGYYFKSTNTDDPTKPKYGWYRYDYFSQVWVPIFATVNDEYPEYNLFDQRHIEGSGDGTLVEGSLYLFDEDQAQWTYIEFIDDGGVDDNVSDTLPVDPSHGDYYKIDGSIDPDYPDGYYRYYGNYWSSQPLSILSSVPDLEDDITIKLSKPNIYVSTENIDSVNIVSVNDLTGGSYELVLGALLGNRKYNNFSPKDDFSNSIQVNILINSGDGKYQIGKVDNITWSGSGEDYEEIITISGIHYGINSENTVVFFNTENMIDVDGSEVTLTKKDLMDQVTDIINYVPTTDAYIDTDIIPTKINDDDNLFEIKFDLSNAEIIKNDWYIIRVKSDDAVGSQPTWKNPNILIGKTGDYNTGYINIRYLTITGLYPYYGIDNEKYLVIEDIINGEIAEVQTSSLYRKNTFSFEKFKVIARNLDDTNAEQLYTDLLETTKQNEIYLDVLNGRVMFHPTIANEINNSGTNYDFRISFIILNTLTGYLTSDNIIHQEPSINKNQKLLYNKIKEMETTFIREFNTAIGRKIFNYRGKYAKLWIDESNTSKAKILENDAELTDGIGYLEDEENENHPYFFCYGDTGQPIVDIYEIEGNNPLPRLMAGDQYVQDYFFIEEGFAKTNDYVKNDATWYKFNGATWDSVSGITSDTSFPVGPSYGDLCERTDHIDGGNLYVYDETKEEWIFVNFAFANDSDLPTTIYTENNITLESNPTPPEINDEYFIFSTGNTIDKHYHLGIVFEPNIAWDFANVHVALYRTIDNALVGTVSKSKELIENIVNATDLKQEEKFVYFKIEATLNTETEYYYHIYYDGVSVENAPVIKGYDETSNAKGFMKILATPDAGYGYINNIFKLLNSSNETVAFEINEDLSSISTDIDETKNLPVVEGGGLTIYNIIIGADFSDNDVWSKWNYGKAIGVDIKTGRIKFPSDISIDTSTLSVEFNVNWLNSYITAKAISVSLNNNASIEDVYQIVDIYDNDIEAFIEERIAQYSPQERRFIALGGSEQFDIDFLPDDASGGDSALDDLMVFVNGFYKNSTTYTLNTKQLEFEEELNVGDKVVVKGRDYKVLTTVSNGTITPDHFSDATQQLIQELQDIRDVDVPSIVSNAKQDFSIQIENAINESLVPKENIFQFDDINGFIQRYNFETETWDNVSSASSFNDLLLTWTPYSKTSLTVYVNGYVQSSRTFSIDNQTINFNVDLDDADDVVIKGNISRPAQVSTVTIEPTEYVEVVATAPKSIFTTDFLTRAEENLAVFVDGLLQPSSQFTLTHTSVEAQITGEGTVGLTAETDFTGSDPFEIAINGNEFVAIQLTDNCDSLATVLSHINTKLADNGLDTLVEAVDSGTNNVTFKTKFLPNNPFGSRYKIEINDSSVPSDIFDIDFGTETSIEAYGTDGESIVTFNEDVNVGVTVVIKGGIVVEQTIPDGRIEDYHLSSDLQTKLNISASSSYLTEVETDATINGIGILGDPLSVDVSSLNVVSDSEDDTKAGKLTLSDTDDSTDKDTGVLVVDGGIGIEKRINAGGKISTLDQLESSIADGTPPLVVTSETLVDNLNVDKLDGADLSVDETMASNSDQKVPSEKAVKTYAEKQAITYSLIFG